MRGIEQPGSLVGEVGVVLISQAAWLGGVLTAQTAWLGGVLASQTAWLGDVLTWLGGQARMGGWEGRTSWLAGVLTPWSGGALTSETAWLGRHLSIRQPCQYGYKTFGWQGINRQIESGTSQ